MVETNDVKGQSGAPAGTVSIPPPVGRGLLHWAEKQVPACAAVPALRLCEQFFANENVNTGAADQPGKKTLNRLYHADNRALLAYLLAEGWAGRMRLIYIDPPFDSGLAYARKVRTRGPNSRVVGELVQYRDSWTADTYLQFMYERLLLLRPLLADDGVIWLHCDYRQSHRLQLILEEVFGPENYLNTIAWRSQVARGAKVNAFYFPNSTHFLHVFAKDRQSPPVWNPPRKRLTFTRRQAASQFLQDEQGFFRTSDPGTYSFARLKELHAAGRLYAPFGGQVVVDEAGAHIYCSNGGNVGVKYYLEQDADGRYSVERGIDNLWDDIPGLGTTPGEDLGYPTQKTGALLERVIQSSTNPGDWVLDCFAGSGTTPAVAQALGRRWIACDAGYGAVQTTRRRLQAGLAHASQNGSGPGFELYVLPGTERELPAVELSDEPPVDLRVKRVGGNEWLIFLESSSKEWQTWIDTVEIDPDFDGSVFRPRFVDAPLRRRALIAGKYSLAAQQLGAVLAVRVTWITGREQVFVQNCPPA